MSEPRALSDAEREDLVAFLDGELDPAAARALESKLQSDPKARAEADALRRTWAMLDVLPRPATSPAFTTQTMERLSVQLPVPTPAPARSGFLRRWLVPLAWAEGILLIGLLAYAGGKLAATRSEPAPPAADPLTSDQHLERDLRVVENFRRYQHVPDLEFLRGIADPNDPDLFGDTNPAP